MSTKKATGLDNLSPRLVKEAAPIISESLAIIFNKTIDTGLFPTKLKTAKVTPVHKANDKDNVNNYRPISVISTVAKVYERIVFDQLYNYLNRNNLLSKFQSGFRPNHSTATAMLDATNEWLSNMDKGLINCVTLLDFSKAFDTVDHTTLLHKLSLYGVAENSLAWFKSYLTNRQQRSFVNGQLSSFKPLTCGVPQGSILGPLLFLIYINDLPNSLQFSTPRMYADDTNITTSGKSLNHIIQSANSDLSSITQWLLTNKLSLNVTMTEQLFIGSDDNLRKINDKSYISIDNNPIERVSESKTIGVVVDERLSWTAHIDYISKKISSGIGGLRQIRDFITQETAVTVYNSLIQPWFDYCDVVWDKLPATSAERLQKLQNRAARVITKQGYEIRSKDIRRSLNWDDLAQRRYKHKATMMFKVLNDGSPSCLKDLFTPKSLKYSLRQRENQLFLVKPRTEYLKRAFVYDGAKLWNKLPRSMRLQSKLSTFKQELSSIEP